MERTLVHIGPAARGEQWQALLPTLVPGLTVRQWPDIGDPAQVAYVAAWTLPDDLFDRLPAIELVFSVGAGIDQLDPARMPAAVALARTIEPGLVGDMVDYATLAVLAVHRDLPAYRAAQAAGDWTPLPVRDKRQSRVGIMGLGAMGAAIAERIVGLGFPVHGWSRSARSLPGVVHHAGDAALPGFLGCCDILLCVLPLTSATRHILNATTLAMLPAGAAIVNIGRGGHVDEAALLAALDGGQVRAAVLDVTATEPLATGHPFWTHPRVMLTPHVAGDTDPDGGARAVATDILRHQCGLRPHGLVDRSVGY